MKHRIKSGIWSLIIEQNTARDCHLVWFGPSALEDMAGAAAFQRLPASPDQPVGPLLMPEHGQGFHGVPQIEAACLKTCRRTRLGTPVISSDLTSIVLEARDVETGLAVSSAYRLMDDGGLAVTCKAENSGPAALDIHRAASALLPVPDWASEVLTHAGAWGREGHQARRDWPAGRIEQLGRSGRPGFDGGPTLTVCEAATTELAGRALAVHLAWSGPFRLAADRARDGSAQILAERLFFPGECRLQPGEMLLLPEAIIVQSHTGFNGLSDVFHSQFRQRSRPMRRRVQFNTWEARYFAVDESGCIALAKAAADLGAERFVLDDGWFSGRRNDTSSLGDWRVDTGQFPNGLQPLIDAVHEAGMDFGLWVEPEMVSPDSDLYRAHPDWVLGFPERNLPTGRNQLVLNLALSAVQEHLHGAITALLDTYPIAYLKWDCNRDLYPATRNGLDRSGDQTEGLYNLLDRISGTHPHVEIESCASGGGRIDAGIARFANRFWTSDATDAIDRIRIQRAASLVVPPEMLGTHVGPSPNPMTGRPVPMVFRILTALFGHFGIEADPDKMPDCDQDVLRRGIGIYRDHRDWMACGRWVRISAGASDPDVQLVIALGGNQALLRILRVDTPVRPLQPRIRLAGLEPQARYRLNEFVMEGDPPFWLVGEFSGAGLMVEGLMLDPGRALTGRLIHLERIGR